MISTDSMRDPCPESTGERMAPQVRRTISDGYVRVYLAGKVSRRDWRHGLVPCLEFVEGEIDWRLHHVIFSAGDSKLSLLCSGPFFVGSGHGLGHGDATHGCAEGNSAPLSPVAREHVHTQCTNAIYNSDVVLAWVDDLTCYGTIWELAYAQAIGVPTVVAMPKAMGQETANDLWFTLQRALFIWAETPAEALKAAIQPFERMRENEWKKRCESPIERRLLDAILADGRFEFRGKCWSWGLCYLTLQEQAGPYRLDFAVTGPGWKIDIECDGHDFHERTKEQAARDRSRDRELTLDGWTVLRFTGSEIHKNVAMCAEQVFEAILRQTEAAQ